MRMGILIQSFLACVVAVFLAPDLAIALTVEDFVPGGTLTSAYCERKRNGKQETHAGVDIGKKDVTGKWTDGHSVKAGVAGTVVKVYMFDGTHNTGDGVSDSD